MLIFEIHSPPEVQKQTRFHRVGDKIIKYDPSLKAKQHIQWQIKAYAPSEPYAGPIKVDLTFYLPIPKATSKVKKRQMVNGVILPAKRPDLDNLAYLMTNAMKEIIYLDDSQIVDACNHKRYGEEPKTVVKIIPIYNTEQNFADDCG